MSRRTDTEIEFELVDVAAKSDSALGVSDKQSFSDIEQLEHDGITFQKYASLEPDRWALNGTFTILPDNTAGVAVGWWSLRMSDANRAFSSPPTLTITFSEHHSSIGLTFYFYYEDWVSKVRVQWYGDGRLIADKTDTPNETVYSVLKAVENYDKIVVTFLETNRPFRYVHLTRIDYGVIRKFTGENEIMAAQLHEEIDPISEDVAINTLDFRLHSTDAEFSIINPAGIYRYLQQRQRLSVYEKIDGERRFLATHYLNEWSNENENTFNMSAIDALGLMDGSTFLGGMYHNIPAKTLLETIVLDAGFVLSGTGEILIDLQPALQSIGLTGYLPIVSHREAIQQVAFAIGAAVDTSRSDRIRIYRVTDTAAGTISRKRKFTGQSVSLRQFVTGVEVTEHAYSIGTESKELFKGVLSVGRNMVTFSNPASMISVSGAALIKADVNYAIVDVTVEGEIIVTGTEYVDNTRTASVHIANLPSGQIPNILQVKDATLVSRSNSASVAQWVFGWNKKRIQQEFPFIQDTESVGSSYRVETLYDQIKTGVLTSLDTDLAKGFIGKAVVIGE